MNVGFCHEGALKELAKLLPDKATRIIEDGTEQVRVDELAEGDRVLVRPGERVPVDGVIFEGKSNLNESMITGESEPVSPTHGASCCRLRSVPY